MVAGSCAIDDGSKSCAETYSTAASYTDLCALGRYVLRQVQDRRAQRRSNVWTAFEVRVARFGARIAVSSRSGGGVEAGIRSTDQLGRSKETLVKGSYVVALNL
jgi:hypothetical protein